MNVIDVFTGFTVFLRWLLGIKNAFKNIDNKKYNV